MQVTSGRFQDVTRARGSRAYGLPIRLYSIERLVGQRCARNHGGSGLGGYGQAIGHQQYWDRRLADAIRSFASPCGVGAIVLSNPKGFPIGGVETEILGKIEEALSREALALEDGGAAHPLPCFVLLRVDLIQHLGRRL